MRGLSIRLKMTLWFSAALLIVVALTFVCVFSISRSVVLRNVRDDLIGRVEDNVGELEYFTAIGEMNAAHASDQYIAYGDGYLEMDGDFLDDINGVSIALYTAEGELLYGENPIARDSSQIVFTDRAIRTVEASGTTYYLFDRALHGQGVEGLWLRGVVSQQQGAEPLSRIVRICLILLPSLVIVAILGGYFFAGRSLKPIDRIARAAAEINDGRDLKKRIDLGEGEDEIHRLAQTFDRMFDRLDASFEAERQFTSDVSHELRTPMTVIMAQSQYTLESAKTVEEYRESLEVITRQGEKMNKLIEEMLRFTRLERGAEHYPFEEVNLSALVTQVAEEMSLIGERGIRLTWHVEEDVFVRGNAELLSRMLINLITNAYRYGKDNGSVTVTLTKSPLALSVTDDGIGIAPEDSERIFRRFYQADSARSGQGTGLGLAMVREIARLHGGEVRVESVLGQGSTFTFTIE